MNPGPVEEVGQTARGLIDALKRQPSLLALMISNIGMLVFMFYALHAAAQFRDSIIARQFELQRHFNDILSRCVVPAPNRTRIELL